MANPPPYINSGSIKGEPVFSADIPSHRIWKKACLPRKCASSKLNISDLRIQQSRCKRIKKEISVGKIKKRNQCGKNKKKKSVWEKPKKISVGKTYFCSFRVFCLLCPWFSREENLMQKKPLNLKRYKKHLLRESDIKKMQKRNMNLWYFGSIQEWGID